LELCVKVLGLIKPLLDLSNFLVNTELTGVHRFADLITKRTDLLEVHLLLFSELKVLCRKLLFQQSHFLLRLNSLNPFMLI
jgi:hypothetical protein